MARITMAQLQTQHNEEMAILRAQLEEMKNQNINLIHEVKSQAEVIEANKTASKTAKKCLFVAIQKYNETESVIRFNDMYKSPLTKAFDGHVASNDRKMVTGNEKYIGKDGFIQNPNLHEYDRIAKTSEVQSFEAYIRTRKQYDKIEFIHVPDNADFNAYCNSVISMKSAETASTSKQLEIASHAQPANATMPNITPEMMQALFSGMMNMMQNMAQ